MFFTGEPSLTVTSEYATLYLTAPFVVLTESACESPGPGFDGSLNGNAVACIGAGAELVVVVGVVVVVVVSSSRSSSCRWEPGVESLRIATAG